MNNLESPTLQAIRTTQEQITPYIYKTPTWQWRSAGLSAALGSDTTVHCKLELLQVTGSFKPRGALCVMQSLTKEQLACGVTAVSAGNHAIAVAYAASKLGTHAKVVMPESANRVRREACLELGAAIELLPDVHQAFARLKDIAQSENRAIVHPFEGPLTTLGTATLGAEFLEQVGELDALIVPIGGGGLASGVAAAASILAPKCLVYGVEPLGADSMSRSFSSGSPEVIESVTTIADSLGAPCALPYSFAVCRRHLTKIALVSDAQLQDAMRIIFRELKLAVEPAGAVAVAGLLGPLRELVQGKRVGVIMCGSNIDAEGFYKLLSLQ